MTLTLTQANAYAIGYFEARTHGYEITQFENSDMRAFYKLGYDAGIFDYGTYDADNESLNNV